MVERRSAGRRRKSASGGRSASRPSRSRGNPQPASRAVRDASAVRPGCRNRRRSSPCPTPKISCHMRLTATRAVSGCSSVNEPSREARGGCAAARRPSAAAPRRVGLHAVALLIVCAAVEHVGERLLVGALFHHQRHGRRGSRSAAVEIEPVLFSGEFAIGLAGTRSKVPGAQAARARRR